MYEPGTRILDKYVLRVCIGSGAFGEVWSADSASTGEPVAVKMERIRGNPAPTLQYESRVLQLLQNMVGIPRLRYFGRKDDMDGIFMVTDLLGPSLETLATSPRLDLNEHALKNPPPHHEAFISHVGRQMLQRLKSVHGRGMLHRDVKPDNFLFARTPELDLSSRRAGQAPTPLLYLIDFGMAKRIKDPMIKEGQPQPQHGFPLIGSARYASAFAHRGEPLGRRDDLISMMYSLIYVACGGALPWQNYTEREIYYIKDNMTPSEICAGLSQRHATQWAYILERLHGMQAHDVPAYADIELLM
jgi:serine/threonine protein kinase